MLLRHLSRVIALEYTSSQARAHEAVTKSLTPTACWDAAYVATADAWQRSVCGIISNSNVCEDFSCLVTSASSQTLHYSKSEEVKLLLREVKDWAIKDPKLFDALQSIVLDLRDRRDKEAQAIIIRNLQKQGGVGASTTTISKTGNKNEIEEQSSACVSADPLVEQSKQRGKRVGVAKVKTTAAATASALTATTKAATTKTATTTAVTAAAAATDDDDSGPLKKKTQITSSITETTTAASLRLRSKTSVSLLP